MPWSMIPVVFEPTVRKLCPQRYPNHTKGCPNYGKKDGCPPKAPLFVEVCDMEQPTFVIWTRFEFGAHVARMKKKHSEWSDLQLKCCLYWQGTARKVLKGEIEEFKRMYPTYQVTRCPEGMGLNITETMKKAGIELEWPPEKYTYQVAVGFVWTKGDEGENERDQEMGENHLQSIND